MPLGHWSDDELEQLRLMYLEGTKLSEIATALRRTTNAISMALNQYSISRSEHYQKIRLAAIRRAEKEWIGK